MCVFLEFTKSPLPSTFPEAPQSSRRNLLTDFCIMFESLKFPLSLGSDNHSGVHPKVMEAILNANRGHAHAYGMDELCKLTDQEFKRIFGPNVDAQYVYTGTAANVLGLADR